MMNTFISKFTIINPNKQVVTKERLRLTLKVMVMKTTLAQDCKNFNSTCWLQVNHPQLLKQNIYFVFMFWSLEVDYLCKCNMYFCKNTSLLTDGCSTHITSAGARTGARTGIVRCPDGHRPVPGRASADSIRYVLKFLALVRHRTMPGRAPYGARTGTVGIVRFEF